MDGLLERRLATLRNHRPALVPADEDAQEIRGAIARVIAAADDFGPPRPTWQTIGNCDPASLARRLAAGLDGDAIETERGWYVRRELRPTYLPIDRARLAGLPCMPAPETPLLCLDTETTGLGSAVGTLAFMIGLGLWENDRIRLIQLLLPDQSEEEALLEALAREIPADAWLVTYNGRGFDIPLLETRFRMNRHPLPATGGHLDLLLLMRRLFRYRLPDARLQTIEKHLLRRHRPPDIPAWEIPNHYHAFLRGGPAAPLRVVARHNAEDVVTLGRILAHLERGYAAGEVRSWAPPGDLTRLARLYRHELRIEEALGCLEEATKGLDTGLPDAAQAAIEMARLLRREGRLIEAGAVWARLSAAPGPLAALGWIELAKEREHRGRDVEGAWAATDQALLALYRNRSQGGAMMRRGLEEEIAHRRRRLARKLGRG